MPYLMLHGQGRPYRIKVSGVRVGNHTQYYNKQLGHVASRKLRSHTVVCYVRIPGFDHDNASIVPIPREESK